MIHSDVCGDIFRTGQEKDRVGGILALIDIAKIAYKEAGVVGGKVLKLSLPHQVSHNICDF